MLEARRSSGFASAAVQRIAADVQIAGGIARYFAEKFRAAVWAELFIATKVTWLIEPTLDYAKRSVMAWEAIAGVSRDLYHDDLTFGPQSWLRGSWHSRLPEMQAELLDLEGLRGARMLETVPSTPQADEAVASLRARQAVLSRPLDLEAAATFTAGEPYTVHVQAEADGEPVLHFRHVNQAERWRSLPMSRSGNGYEATIPGDYTDSEFHLQYFISLRQSGRDVLSPGLSDNLSNEPYHVVLQH